MFAILAAFNDHQRGLVGTFELDEYLDRRATGSVCERDRMETMVCMGVIPVCTSDGGIVRETCEIILTCLQRVGAVSKIIGSELAWLSAKASMILHNNADTT